MAARTARIPARFRPDAGIPATLQLGTKISNAKATIMVGKIMFSYFHCNRADSIKLEDGHSGAAGSSRKKLKVEPHDSASWPSNRLQW